MRSDMASYPGLPPEHVSRPHARIHGNIGPNTHSGPRKPTLDSDIIRGHSPALRALPLGRIRTRYLRPTSLPSAMVAVKPNFYPVPRTPASASSLPSLCAHPMDSVLAHPNALSFTTPYPPCNLVLPPPPCRHDLSNLTPPLGAPSWSHPSDVHAGAPPHATAAPLRALPPPTYPPYRPHPPCLALLALAPPARRRLDRSDTANSNR